MLIELLYTSTATGEMTEEQLAGLLEHCRRNNEAAGITGLLIFHEGTFMQVLEGEKQAVMDLYQRILLDPRHTGSRVLWQLPIEARTFGDWSMAFRPLSDLDPTRLEGYSRFLESGSTDSADGQGSSKALELMRIIGDIGTFSDC